MQGLRHSHLLYGPSWWPKKRKVKNDKGLGGRASRRLPDRQKLDLEREWAKTIEFYCHKWKTGTIWRRRNERDPHQVLQIAAKNGERGAWTDEARLHRPLFTNTVRTPHRKLCLGNKFRQKLLLRTSKDPPDTSQMIPNNFKQCQTNFQKFGSEPWTWPLGYGGWLDASKPLVLCCGSPSGFSATNVF